MSVEDIIAALEKEAQAQRQEITTRAKKQAKQIIGEAEVESRAIGQDHGERLIGRAENEAIRLLHQADSERQTSLAQARETLVEKALETARSKLAAVTESSAYPALFMALTAEAWEAAASLSGDRVVVVNEKDFALAERTLNELSLKAEIRTDNIQGGGLVIMSKDGRRKLANTLLGRLDRAAPMLTPHVTEILFGHD